MPKFEEQAEIRNNIKSVREVE